MFGWLISGVILTVIVYACLRVGSDDDDQEGRG